MEYLPLAFDGIKLVNFSVIHTPERDGAIGPMSDVLLVLSRNLGAMAGTI